MERTVGSDHAGPLVLSYSQIASYRRCPQAYKYSYLDNLAPKLTGTPLVLGTILHKYLEEFYTHMVELGGARSHGAAVGAIRAEYEREIRALATTAVGLGQEDVGEEFIGMLERAVLIADRYYEIHGNRDAQVYEVLQCEYEFNYPLRAGELEMHGVIDLITRDATGSIALWEHKTSKSPPPPRARLRDLQTLIYAAVAEEVFGYDIDRIVWNNVRTKVPTEPKILKSGDLSRDKRIDTTWHVYQRAIESAGMDIADYMDMREILENKERTDFFPRHELPRVADEAILLKDVVATATAIQRMRTRFAEHNNARAVRNLDRACDWCFAEGTSIMTAVGRSKKIEDIRVGDKLVAYDKRRGNVVTTVTSTMRRHVDSLCAIRFASGHKLYVTDDHPFLVNGAWVRARDLKVGIEVAHANKGDKASMQMKAKNPMRDPAVAMNKQNGTPGVRFTDEHRQRISTAKLANGSEQARRARRATRRPPTPIEAEFISIYREAGLPLKWVGNGTMWIGNRNPDFVVKNEKKVIEIMAGGEAGYGRDRRRDLEDQGYKVLVINSNRKPIRTIGEVWAFIHNGDRIVSIKEVVRRKLWTGKWVTGPFLVYNLECSPYHNYYGNTILGHNCEFNKLCDATLTGGNIAVELARYFEPRKGRDGNNRGSEDDDDDEIIDLFSE